MAVDAELTRDHARRLDTGFAAVLERRAREASGEGVDLAAFDGPEGFGAFLATTAAGLKHETRTEAAYCDAVRRLCTVVSVAARPRSGSLHPSNKKESR